VHAYATAFERYGQPFDEAILRDMAKLGYALSDDGTKYLRNHARIELPEPLIGMFVKEVDRQTDLPQMFMSQGMFRALAMVVYVNIASFSKQRTLFLVDDIGEGLDYERSSGLIDLLVQHSRSAGLQLIMTTNDRFVMNRVPLEYWSLLRRQGPVVKAFTERNSAKEFEEFKFMGLSNFDFFSSAAFN
jgi:hypothetical protein